MIAFDQHPHEGNPAAARDASRAPMLGGYAATTNYRPLLGDVAATAPDRPRIRYRDSGNALHTVPLPDAEAGDVAVGFPIRALRSRRGARSMVGFWWTARLNALAEREMGSRQLLATESTVETRFLLATEFNQQIRSASPQPFRILAPGKPCHNHVPDFMLVHADRTIVICDVRPAALFTAKDEAVAESFRDEIAALGWYHLIWHDLDPVVHDNLSWLARVRRDGVADPRAVTAARTLIQNDTYGSLERKIIDAGVPAVFVRPGIDRLIWTHEIQIDLASNLDIDTILRPASNPIEDSQTVSVRTEAHP